MVKRIRWGVDEIPRTPRPSNVPKTVWSRMGLLQRYNLSNGLLIWDKKTKKCKWSRLSETTGAQIPRELEFVSSDVVVPKRLQKKKKKVANKKSSTHHRSIDPLVMVSGSGSFRLSDKSTYVGEMKNGLLHGSGIRSWRDGSTYTGGWKKGERSGQGTMVYATGEEYIGLWRNDTKTGRGTMFRKNGSIFIADWKNNLVSEPYTKKSSNEQAYDVAKVYLKLGTYSKVADELGISEERVRKLVVRYRRLNSEEEQPKWTHIHETKNPFPTFKLTHRRKQFVTATEKIFGRVTVINRKMIHEVLDKNKNLSFPGWAVSPLLRTSTRGWHYFPNNKGKFNLKKKVVGQPKPKRTISSTSIEKLELTPKTLGILKSNGITNIRQLTRRTEVDLLKIPTLRNSVIKELKEGLKELGLELSSAQYYEGGRGSSSLQYRQI